MNTPIHFYKPDDPTRFVGDCMPFSHNGTFYFFHLQDENHHQSLGGLGGHQWALATSEDLRAWQHHPLALPISADWEGSICTGSVLHHAGLFYAFYATRKTDYTQHLSLAVSPDGVHFEKLAPNPFFSPPSGYNPYHFRDPFAFHGPDGRIHLLVTALLETHPIPERGGCLAHLVAADPRGPWEMLEPFFIPGTPDVPECADLFEWNGRFYLIYGSRLQAHYRIGSSLFGPWERPAVDTFEAPAARVMKTAAWGERRIGAAWIGSPSGENDSTGSQWGGQALFRELLQMPDGSLGVRPLAEASPPAAGAPLTPALTPVTAAARSGASVNKLERSGGLEALRAGGIPPYARLNLVLRPGAGSGPFGLRLRAAGFEIGADLELNPAEHTARLAAQELRGWDVGDGAIALEVTLYGDILDVCLGGRHCLAARCAQPGTDGLWIYAIDREVTLENFSVQPLAVPSFG